ncbi:MAG: hypothetical protein ACRDTT_12640, partial [Pseudonocardiaceae bacterium]
GLGSLLATDYPSSISIELAVALDEQPAGRGVQARPIQSDKPGAQTGARKWRHTQPQLTGEAG